MAILINIGEKDSYVVKGRDFWGLRVEVCGQKDCIQNIDASIGIQITQKWERGWQSCGKKQKQDQDTKILLWFDGDGLPPLVVESYIQTRAA